MKDLLSLLSVLTWKRLPSWTLALDSFRSRPSSINSVTMRVSLNANGTVGMVAMYFSPVLIVMTSGRIELDGHESRPEQPSSMIEIRG